MFTNKKIISMLLMLTLLFTFGGTAFASSRTVEVDGISFTIMNENQIIVETNEEKSLITQEQTQNGLKTTVFNFDTKETSFFIRDNISGTVYSSITGKTLKADKSFEDSSLITLDSVSEETYKSNENKSYDPLPLVSYMSYNKLAGYVGASAGVAVIIAAISTHYGLSVLALVSQIISGILVIINAGLQGQSSNHGLKIHSKLYEITKHQGGGVITFYQRKIYSVSTY